MDFKATDAFFSRNDHIYGCNQDGKFGIPALSLDHGYGMKKTKIIEDSQKMDLPSNDDGCTLVLGLGPTPSFYSSAPIEATETNEPSIQFSLSLGNDVCSDALQLGLSRGSGDAFVSAEHGDLNSVCIQSQFYPTETSLFISNIDDGSTSAKTNSGGYMPSLLLAPRLDTDVCNGSMPETKDLSHYNYQLEFSPDPSATTDCSMGVASDSFIDMAHYSERHHHHPKKCRFKGCSKGARGSSGLCIAHGGGQRCQKSGCNKGAESRAAFCKSHGGGRRCQHLGCTKSAEGKTEYCIAHGGGRRCGHPAGCAKAARGKSGLCIKHGGGKRCKVEGCTRSAEGQAGLCISHGGGRRCRHPECSKGAQGSTVFCKAHGGGKRCIFEGCNKGAEGSTPFCKGHGGGKRCLHEGGGVCPKSVHGGTDYCVSHGGGKRCVVSGCTKSARGRTDCCVKHGGGKRCKSEGCGKSAQGSTDFCKAHGGGKRCGWEQGCEKFARGRSGLCAAHSSIMEAEAKEEFGVGNSGSAIASGLFNGLVSGSTTVGSSVDHEYYSSDVSAFSESNFMARVAPPVLLIPPQVLVPSSMKSPPSSSFEVAGEKSSGRGSSFKFDVPEGRVHGGGLLSLLGGNFHSANVVGPGDELA